MFNDGGLLDLEHSSHMRPTLFQRPDKVHDPLYVITPIYNPQRWRTRWKLYEDFAKHCEEAGAILYTVEAAFGERDWAITSPTHPRHIRLRTRSHIWLKENMINVAVARLSQDVPDWKYVAWVDADVQFAKQDWANETIHYLQDYSVVQMWSQFQDLNSNCELNPRPYTSLSFAYTFIFIFNCCCPCPPCPPDYPYYEPRGKDMKPPAGLGPPGLAWACTRKAWDTMGGLFDVSLLGSNDWYMAYAMIGEKMSKNMGGYHPGFRRRAEEWEERASHLHKNIGCVPGLALHYAHGQKEFRRYQTRDQILIQNQYNPDYHLRKDAQGLYHLREDAIALRDASRKYYRERNEDQII